MSDDSVADRDGKGLVIAVQLVAVPAVLLVRDDHAQEALDARVCGGGSGGADYSRSRPPDASSSSSSAGGLVVAVGYMAVEAHLPSSSSASSSVSTSSTTALATTLTLTLTALPLLVAHAPLVVGPVAHGVEAAGLGGRPLAAVLVALARVERVGVVGVWLHCGGATLLAGGQGRMIVFFFVFEMEVG